MLKCPKDCLNLHGNIFCQIFWSLWNEISWKNSVLVVSENLRLFFSILTPDDKYCVSVKESVLPHQFKCYYLQIKKYLLIFFFFFCICICRISIKFGIHSKKGWSSEIICFWNYRLQKAGLLKCPRSPVSQHLWTVNMLKDAKHCINLIGSIFLKFFYHSETNWAGKILF